MAGNTDQSAKHAAPFIFGIGHGDLGDESNDPNKVGDNWVSRLLARSDSSFFNWFWFGYENMFAKFGEALWIEVGEWLDAPETGQVLIQTLGVTGPYYDTDGNSLYDYNDWMFKITEGGREVEIPKADVMDSDVVLIPSASARYPMEGWQPLGQYDMEDR